jgi:hypothetical protein
VALGDAGEIHPGPDFQLVKDMTQVGVHGMRRNEQPVGDSPVGITRSSETGDLKLGVRERLPSEFRAVQGLDPAPDPELA